MLNLNPNSTLVCGLCAGVDPLDAVNAVIQIRINHILYGFFIAAILCVHDDCETLVQVGPRVNQAGVVRSSYCAEASR